MKLNVVNAGKKFGKTWIFRNASMVFEPGKIYGFAGKNGSGKTMLMKCMLGLVPLSEGSIELDGKTIGTDIEMLPSVGAIIETPGFLPNLSGYDNLKYLASLRHLISDAQIVSTMERLGLQPAERKRVGKYSLGMRQRLGLAQALMEDPEILMLDEPFNSLDSDCTDELYEILKEQRSLGKCVILSSHHGNDIAALCDDVFEFRDGAVMHECQDIWDP